MIEKELSPEQIEHLFEFVKKRNVKYIDCQYEIVDHLASAIEEEMENNPYYTFYQALDKVFERFGKSKFNSFTKEREKILQKYWTRKTRGFIKSFFKVPRIIVTFALFVASYHILFNFEKGVKFFIIATLIPFFLFGIYNIYNRYVKKEHRQLLVVKMYDDGTWSFGMSLCCFVGALEHLPPYQNIIFAIINTLYFVMLLLWLYATIFVFPKMIQDELEQKYAHIDYQKVFAK